jgi:alkylation response protein AidB-like acyl-CoA dehydrogenase
MDFGLSEEEKILEQTLLRFVTDSVPTSRVRQIMATDSAYDAAIWTELSDLGVAGILVPEEHGGAGLAVLDACVAAGALGWGACPIPFLGTAVMAPTALRTAGSAAQQQEWLPRIATGKICVGIAATEVFARREGAEVRLDGKVLRGKALFVVDSTAADIFFVAVGCDSLAVVPRAAEGLTIESLQTIDETRRVGELCFDGVQPADWIGGIGQAPQAIERMLDAGRLVLAADILGSCDRALTMSVEYAKERKQFGRVIGSFQAVKHMCAEMAAELEPARSLLWYAAHAFDAVPGEAAMMAAHAKAHLSEVGTALLKTATEVHGGIGFTHEFDLHLWFKRVGLDRQLLGTPDYLRERAARLQGWAAA